MRNLRLRIVAIAAALLLAAAFEACNSGSGVKDTADPGGTDKGGTAPSGTVVDGTRVVTVTARQYEFVPETITVNEGEKVRLDVTSADVEHGFALPEYRIDQKLPPGDTRQISFTADKAGTFEFHCSVFCGTGHMEMKGKLVVLAK